MIDGLDFDIFFKYKADNRTRGYSWVLVKEWCKLDIRKFSFSQRMIDEWNRLPGDCADATGVNVFGLAGVAAVRRGAWARRVRSGCGHAPTTC